MKPIISKEKAIADKVGAIDIMRALPSDLTPRVGPIIFLDHILEKNLLPGEFSAPNGSFAHPHRGIATFTYLLKGELIHFDSNGGYGRVKAGGVQWMNAGNGVIHDEVIPEEFRVSGGAFYGFQFWVNLPAEIKEQAPDYMPVQAEELPLIQLADGQATLKVLLGEYGGKSSPIPAFTQQFIWHIKLSGKASIELKTLEGLEYGGYLPNGNAHFNDIEISARELVVFDSNDTGITISNKASKELEILLFGGEPYEEKIVSHGPFVMNTVEEIGQAYEDFRSGKYGKIDYQITGEI